MLRIRQHLCLKGRAEFHALFSISNKRIEMNKLLVVILPVDLDLVFYTRLKQKNRFWIQRHGNWGIIATPKTLWQGMFLHRILENSEDWSFCGGDRYQFAVEDTRDFSCCNTRDRQRLAITTRVAVIDKTIRQTSQSVANYFGKKNSSSCIFTWILLLLYWTLPLLLTNTDFSNEYYLHYRLQVLISCEQA